MRMIYSHRIVGNPWLIENSLPTRTDPNQYRVFEGEYFTVKEGTGDCLPTVNSRDVDGPSSRAL